MTTYNERSRVRRVRRPSRDRLLIDVKAFKLLDIHLEDGDCVGIAVCETSVESLSDAEVGRKRVEKERINGI